MKIGEGNGEINMISNDEIKEIQNRVDNATKGPWIYSPERHTHDCCIHQLNAKEKYGNIDLDNGGIIGSSEWIWINDADAIFIAAARRDISNLLQELDRVKCERDILIAKQEEMQ